MTARLFAIALLVGACANDPAVHVGLGTTPRVDELVVRWPDGSSESFGPFVADRTVDLRRGQGRVAER